MGSILAIDQGTTSTRAYRVDDDGGMVLVGRQRHRQIHPHPGWVEHDPDELLGAIRALVAAAGPVAAIGIANQGETVIAWDAATKRPIHNAIVWQDLRTQELIARMRADGMEATLRARSGLPLDPYFSASKLRWLLDHVPEAATLRRAGRLRLGTSDAFFLDALTGTFATDAATASRTALMHLARREWDDTPCAAFGVPRECLPEIHPSRGDFGTLPGGTPVVASIVDQQASLFGHGCRARGDLKITFGTGGFALALTGAGVPDDATGLLPTCAWQIGDRAEYALEGGVTSAGAAIEWLQRTGLLAGVDALDRAAASAAEAGLFFVPAQAGLGAPHWDRTARALWIGIDLQTSGDQLCRAVMEGIAFRAAELVDAFAAALGPAGRISLDGGLSRSAAFTRFLAGTLGRPVEICAMDEVTALGLAALCRDGPPAHPATRRVDPVPLPPGLRERFRRAVERARDWEE